MIRVLVVDDAPIIRESLTQSVEEFDDTIVVAGCAANGRSALEWLEKHYADLCITDIRMPVMDGLALIEQINNRFSWMMCMVVSSYDDFEYAKQSIQLQALDYILKPVKPEMLELALKKATHRLHQERSRDAASLLVKNMTEHRSWKERWLEQIRTLHMETMPLLIVETLELLENWVAGQYHLLSALSNAWLQTLVDELAVDKIHPELHEGKDLGLGAKELPLATIRSYFRLCAVRRLEEGAHRLMEAMRGVRDQQTVRRVDLIKEYIKRHFNKNINLQELAEAIGMNKTYMCTLFKLETGMTVLNYIVAERMGAARSLLLETDAKVYEIANQIGYEDVVYFSQVFKKHYGMNPMEYKRRMKS